MRKFYLAVVLAVLVVGCSQKSDETTMLPSDMTAANKEVTISLGDQTLPPTTEMTTTATATVPAVSEITLPVDASALTLESPTNQQIQQALQNAGLYQGSIDGVIGKKTKSAIKAFQEQNGLTADGKVGKKTWAKLAPFLSTPAATTLTVTPSN